MGTVCARVQKVKVLTTQIRCSLKVLFFRLLKHIVGDPRKGVEPLKPYVVKTIAAKPPVGHEEIEDMKDEEIEDIKESLTDYNIEPDRTVRIRSNGKEEMHEENLMIENGQKKRQDNGSYFKSKYATLAMFTVTV